MGESKRVKINLMFFLQKKKKKTSINYIKILS